MLVHGGFLLPRRIFVIIYHMQEKIITVENLKKDFSFAIKKESGFFSNLLHPEVKIVKAVDDISFSVDRGEILAFIGPNGAGKSTTIKILTGILYPSSGVVRVAGSNPQLERKKLAFEIGTVFGQRSQLIFNLPLRDSFELFGRMYELSSKQIHDKGRDLVDLFEMNSFSDQPVRKLSLGQRMRAEIALSLLHSPKIVFLDEPTIGLDVVAKKKLREILLRLNKDFQTTIFLTSHDAGDIEALCKRTIIINHGKVVIDAETASVSKEYITEKYIRLVLTKDVPSVEIPGVTVVNHEDAVLELKIDTTKHSIQDILKIITNKFEIEDITVKDPPLEEIISFIYERRQ